MVDIQVVRLPSRKVEKGTKSSRLEKDEWIFGKDVEEAERMSRAISRSRGLGSVQERRGAATAVGGCWHDVGVLEAGQAREAEASGGVGAELALVPEKNILSGQWHNGNCGGVVG